MAVEASKDGEGHGAVRQHSVASPFSDCWSKTRSPACTGLHLKWTQGNNPRYRLAAASGGAYVRPPQVNVVTRKGANNGKWGRRVGLPESGWLIRLRGRLREGGDTAGAAVRPRAPGDLMRLLHPTMPRRRSRCLHSSCSSLFSPPRLRSCVPPQASCSRARPTMDSGRPKVLLVEDMEINRVLVRRMARELDVALEEAENGQVAVEYCRQGRRYDIILMDKDMPVMDGHEATRQLRDLGVMTPIVALSGDSLPLDQDLFFQAGADGFQTKPLSKQELVRLLARFVLVHD